jgi:2-(1,2-epoxy-1,2-dihydrophenyl)acetyl-CoA isomerase
MPTITQSNDSHVALVTLDRPARFNALDVDAATELAGSLTALALDDNVRAIVLTGAPPAFSGGGDLKWVTSHPNGASAAFLELAAEVNRCVVQIMSMPKPVIAAINGAAAGGGFSLALACDFRIMSDTATLKQAYTSNGLCIDAAGTRTLPRLVGLARALEIAALDPPIDAMRALEMGLVTRVVPASELTNQAMAFATDLSSRSVNAFGTVKVLMTQSYETSLDVQLEAERQGIADCGKHHDGREGLAAFVEKRRPVYARKN